MLASRIDMTLVSWERIASVLGITTADAVLQIRKKPVLCAILKALEPLGKTPHHAQNMRTLKALGKLPPTFPEMILRGVNYSAETLQWLIIIYLKLGAEHQQGVFQRQYNSDHSCWIVPRLEQLGPHLEDTAAEEADSKQAAVAQPAPQAAVAQPAPRPARSSKKRRFSEVEPFAKKPPAVAAKPAETPRRSKRTMSQRD